MEDVAIDDVFLQLLCSRTITDPEAGAAIVERLTTLTPEWAPVAWGTTEPLQPADLDELSRVWSDGLFWQGTPEGRPHGSVFAMPGTHYPTLRLSSPAGLVDGERGGRLLRDLAVLTGGVYGYLHRLTSTDLATTEARSGSITARRGPQMHTALLSLAQSGLPNIWWANIFGPPVVQLLGAERIADAPAYRVEQLDDDLWYLQLTESILDNDTDPDRFEVARAAVKAHLGADAFYDPAKGRRGPYRTIRLPPAIPVPDQPRSAEIAALGPPGFTQQPDIRARWEPWSRRVRSGVWEIDLPADALVELVSVLPADNRTAEINEIPTLDTFAAIAAAVPLARFSGRVVGPVPGTEGVSIEQLWVPEDTKSPLVDNVAPSADDDTRSDGGRTLWWT